MSFSADTTDHDDSEMVSYYTTSDESSEGIAATLSKSFSFRCQPVLALKLKNSFRSEKICGGKLPALTASLSYTQGHQSNFMTAVVKPTNARNKWVRKIKWYPQHQEIKLVSQVWAPFDGLVRLQANLGWVAGNKTPTFSYMAKTRWDREPHTASKLSIPKSSSLVELRSHWNIKSIMPQMSGQIGGGDDSNSVTQPYVHVGVPKVELVLNAGKPSHWRSIWPPTQWFSNKKQHARKKLQWEQSLDHDSRKDTYIQLLSPEERQRYNEAHDTDF